MSDADDEVQFPAIGCEVCGAEAKNVSTGETEGAYVEVTLPDGETPSPTATEFTFCSLEHAGLFFKGTNPEVTHADE